MRTVALLVLLATTVACGSGYYDSTVNAATARLEQARSLGAETEAPYEYYFAKEHLEEARLQASDSSYHDAANYAETAETYAQKAIDKVRASKSSSEAGK